jgi:hypothetical protein
MSYLIECPTCEATMGVTVKGEVTEPSNDEGGGPWRISLAQCPKCMGAIIGVQESDFFDDWESPVRVWPSPPLSLSHKIPREIRESLEEAYRCLKAKAFTASVVMSGRALEAIGGHFFPRTEERKRPLMLRESLDKLAETKVIDTRLHQWGLALQSERNLAAHPSGTHFNGQDAQDAFKFANNICEYIFVLSADFSEFDKRRGERSKSKKTTPLKVKSITPPGDDEPIAKA